ncbi:SMP-30/gluconolactonase/LRE family protein [Candidatus Litorirhabdus singularis]|uniref:SMP-30/gluconolactonase/LRE family protein n=1 Tax=Candidatus Litorirhabdus singularis TaxID=2518993 RepID=UPI002430F089|nr:SMP-30/gluconolactonase/LRE family protein [Candidatus Litorirhabdus singularis]
MSELHTIVAGLAFPECPRWHDGSLWFSDMHADQVIQVSASGKILQTLEVPGNPGGLGWLPDGQMLIVGMKSNLLYRLMDATLEVYADLGTVHTHQSNDMVVGDDGTAYIGNFGFDLMAGDPPQSTQLAQVAPGGAVSAGPSELSFPNGMVITDAGKTLVVAESWGNRLTAFSIAADGSLSQRRVWAELGKLIPDGICLDAEGCIWVSACANHACVRVREGGEVLESIDTGNLNPFACMLGGADGHTLFMCNAGSANPKQTLNERSGRIDCVQVSVPAAPGE